MFSGLRGRLLAIGGICLMCLWALLGPLLTAEDPGDVSPIKLGLDLRGGTHLVMQVSDPEGAMTTEARTDAANRARTRTMVPPHRTPQGWRFGDFWRR